MTVFLDNRGLTTHYNVFRSYKSRRRYVQTLSSVRFVGTLDRDRVLILMDGLELQWLLVDHLVGGSDDLRYVIDLVRVAGAS